MAPRCWAAARGDCDQKMSREHIFSEKFFTSSHVTRQGHRGSGPETVSKAAIVAKVLCARHNSALSALDNEAITLHRALRARKASKSPEPMEVTVDGWLLERWALKCTAGVFAAGWARHPGESQRRALNISPDILAAIFGERRLPDAFGLSVITQAALEFPGEDAVAWWPLTHPQQQSQVVGIVIALNGFCFTTVTHSGDLTTALRQLAPGPKMPPLDWPRVETFHRPRQVTVGVGTPPRELKIALEW